MLKDFLSDRPFAASVIIFAIATTTIISALIFEYGFGYQACELCYLQRKPWYFMMSYALLLSLFAAKGEVRVVRWGLLVAGLVLLGEMGLAIWHAGIEWKWWPGPASCTRTQNLTGALPDLSKRVILCDEAAVRIFGISLAGWNAVVSLLTALIAFWGMRGGKARVS